MDPRQTPPEAGRPASEAPAQRVSADGGVGETRRTGDAIRWSKPGKTTTVHERYRNDWPATYDHPRLPEPAEAHPRQSSGNHEREWGLMLVAAGSLLALNAVGFLALLWGLPRVAFPVELTIGTLAAGLGLLSTVGLVQGARAIRGR